MPFILSPTGVNAIEYAAELISFIQKIGGRFAAHGPFDHDFDIPHTTLMTGVIHGGTNLNIVPNYCWFDFEIRELPQDDPFAVLAEIKSFADGKLVPRMQAVDPEAGITFEERSLRPSLDTRKRVISLLGAAVDIDGKGVTSVETAVGTSASPNFTDVTWSASRRLCCKTRR